MCTTLRPRMYIQGTALWRHRNETAKEKPQNTAKNTQNRRNRRMYRDECKGQPKKSEQTSDSIADTRIAVNCIWSRANEYLPMLHVQIVIYHIKIFGTRTRPRTHVQCTPYVSSLVSLSANDFMYNNRAKSCSFHQHTDPNTQAHAHTHCTNIERTMCKCEYNPNRKFIGEAFSLWMLYSCKLHRTLGQHWLA